MMLRRLTAITCAVLALMSGACSSSAPDLPSNSDPAAVAEKVTGPGGTEFLKKLTTHEWPDDGRQADKLFGWVSRDADSSDPAAAARASATAHAVAIFLAENRNEVEMGGTTNPALIQAYAAALIPYLGAMVGDPSGTSGFHPLDSLDGEMPRTAQVFAAMAADHAGSEFINAASDRAAAYEDEFANVAAANPTLPDSDFPTDLVFAARLRGLIAAGARIASAQPDPSTQRSVYELQYMIVSRMVHGSDPLISPEYFNPDGSLKSPKELGGGVWSRYNSQLGAYLAAYPQLTGAIEDFQELSSTIAK